MDKTLVDRILAVKPRISKMDASVGDAFSSLVSYLQSNQMSGTGWLLGLGVEESARNRIVEKYGPLPSRPVQ